MNVRIKKDLLKIKDIIRKPVKFRDLRNETDQILIQLNELSKKVDMLEEKLTQNKNSALIMKRKKQILELIKQRPMTASEVGEKLKLSRTRCSEYLNDLVKEGLVEGISRGRKKYFKLVSE